MTETINIPTGEGLTFEKVWLLFQETDRKMQEMAAETDRQMRETAAQMKETDRKMQETDRKFQETDRLLKDLSRKYGDLSGRMGEIVECLVAPGMLEKFNAIGFDVHSKAIDVERYEEVEGKKRLLYEVDVLLEDGNKLIAVEVKSKVKVEHINEHVGRMGKMREYARRQGDERELYGAIAGAVFEESVKSYALKKGFYVVEQSGDTMRIVEPVGKAKAW
jgi:hypothetical protein